MLRLPPERDVSKLTAESLRTIVHELQVHQTELEIQNEELRRTQLELTEARDRYADLYDFAPVGYFTLDPNGLIVEVNLNGAHMVKRERRSLVGKPFVVLVSPQDRDRFYLHLRAVFLTKERQACEIELAAQQGEPIVVRMETLAQGQNGAAALCRAAVSDITQAKRAQAEVLTQERILSSMMEGVCVCDEARRITFVNQAFEHMVGYLSDELLGRDLATLEHCVPEEEGRTLRQEFDQALANGYWRGELLCLRKDGAPFDAMVRVNVLNLSRKKSLVVVWEDITALKQAERALRDSEHRFRIIFESATDLIYIKDRSLRYTHVNPAFARLFDRPVETIVGLTFEKLFGKEGAAYETDVDSRVLQGQTIEEEITRPIDAASRKFHEVKVPLRNELEEIIGLCGIARDITERGERSARPGREPDHSRSKVMQETLRVARRAAQRDSIVLLRGETGCGKDYLARYIHDHSGRAGGPYFSINCGALPPELAESELFGHERGAFTGAHARKRGLLELAEGGTLLLNEIGELPLALQAKLLTFLDTRNFTRVGGEKQISVNARIMAATNRNLEAEVEAGRFRQDLFYRLNVMVIEIPPLRERLEDIPTLVEEITSRLTTELDLAHRPKIGDAMLRSFTQYQWPGNIRELRNAVERAIILGEAPKSDATPPTPGQAEEHYSLTVEFSPGRTLHDLTGEVERALTVEALRRCDGNKKQAARLLGISRDSLYRYLRQFGIESESSTD